MRFYEFSHSLGLHVWDIPALIAAVIMIIVMLVHHHNQKKRQNDFEEELQKKLEEMEQLPDEPL